MSDWTEATDPSSGRTYYVNTATNETSWERPAAMGPDPSAGEEKAEDWTEATDPSSGRKYYVNTKTSTTVWERPAILGPEPGAGEEKAEDWTEATDPSSGRKYYVNTKTSTTVWERPAILGPDPAAAAAAAAPAAAAAAATPAAANPAAGTYVKKTVVKEPEKYTGPSHAKGLTPEVKRLWIKVLDVAAAEASKKIREKNAKFSKLRNFVSLAKKGGDIDHAMDAAIAGVQGEPDGALPSVKAPVLPMLEVELPEIEDKAIEEYAEAYFNLNRKGVFNKATTVEKILSWKTDIIKTSLRKMAKDLAQTAVQAHKNITGFMGDRSTGKETGGHAYKLLNNCMHAPEELRDEIYCQLIKQTTNNPSPASDLKGWQLIAICAGAFPPSKDFEPYLLSYCDKHKDDKTLGGYAKYAIGRIVKSSVLGPRREIPTAIEVEAVKNMHPVAIRVYHLDGNYETMPVTSWTTPPDLNKMMAAKLGVHNADAFAVYEMTPDGEERYLEDDERLLDLVGYWQRLYEEEKGAKDKEGGLSKMYRIVYKVHMYFEPDPRDKAGVLEMFRQAAFDVVSSRYPCEMEDCVHLASLQLCYEQGNDPEKVEVKEKIERYMPAKFIEEAGEHTCANQIAVMHKEKWGKLDRNEAVQRYLAFVKEWKIYGSSFFFVEPQMSHDLPDEVFLAVNPKGVLIINPDTKEVLQEHPYSEVPTWGHSGQSFVLHIGNLIRQTKLYFQTEQGKEINDLVRAYVNHLVVT